MTCRTIAAAVLASSLLAGGTGAAVAQAAPLFKGSLMEDEAAQAPPAPVKAQVSETRLEIVPMETEATATGAIDPIEPPPPPRRRAQRGDPYAPAGIGNNAIRLYPSLGARAVYSSNLNESGTKPESGKGLELRPRLRLESNWIRHSLTGGLDGSLVTYEGSEDYDTKTLDLFQRLRLDVRRHTTANLDASYTLDQEGGDESTEHTVRGSAALTQDFGPMAATLRVGAMAKMFEDVEVNGIKQDNSDRNYIEPSLSLRATFNQPQALRPYVEASYEPRIHHDEFDRNGIARDSQGYGVKAGIEIAAEPFWSGDLGLTYLHRNYKDSSLESAGTFGLSGNLTWSPTELTTVVMAAGTALDETTTATESATRTWTASADVTHALRDNLDLLAGASIEIEETGGSADKTYDANIGLSWKLNPTLSWTAAYDLTWLDAGDGGEDYTEHRVSTGVTVSR